MVVLFSGFSTAHEPFKAKTFLYFINLNCLFLFFFSLILYQLFIYLLIHLFFFFLMVSAIFFFFIICYQLFWKSAKKDPVEAVKKKKGAAREWYIWTITYTVPEVYLVFPFRVFPIYITIFKSNAKILIWHQILPPKQSKGWLYIWGTIIVVLVCKGAETPKVWELLSISCKYSSLAVQFSTHFKIQYFSCVKFNFCCVHSHTNALG